MKTATTFDPWADQDAHDKAIEKGAVYTCPRTGWKFGVRYAAPWSPYLGKASALVMSRQENMDVAKAAQAVQARYILEIGIRSTLIGWKGVTDRQGAPLDQNIGNMLKVFGSLKRLWVDIQSFSTNPHNFGLDQEQTVTEVPPGVDAEGNSPATSDTASEDSAA